MKAKMIDFLIDIFKDSVVDDWRWALVALTGNVFFFLRFFVQWLYSERKGKSCVPGAFWILSLIGSSFIIAYAIHIRNFMILFAILLAVPIYARNLFLMREKNNVGI